MVISKPNEDPDDDGNNDFDDDENDEDYIDEEVQIVKKHRQINKAPKVFEENENTKAAPKKVKNLEDLLRVCRDALKFPTIIHDLDPFTSLSRVEIAALKKDIGN